MRLSIRWLAATLCFPMALSCLPASAWEMSGKRDIVLHARDGSTLPIGTVTFTPQGGRIGIAVDIDHSRFKDFFLSMKEFKCLETASEVFCHVPYPHANPASVTVGDLAWLEHALLFMHKSPQEFGAKLWNGIYYRLQFTDRGLVGTPQAVDLNQIGAPPADPALPPYPAGERGEIPAGSRWFERLSIE